LRVHANSELVLLDARLGQQSLDRRAALHRQAIMRCDGGASGPINSPTTTQFRGIW